MLTVPFRLFIALSAAVFAVECLIMLFLERAFSVLTRLQGAFLDSTILLILTFPLLYFLVVRPLETEIAKRTRLERNLRQHKDDLEALVSERTTALMLANEQLRQDIEERIQAAAERARLVTAIEQTADAVVITDVAGTIEYVNPAFEAITGYSAGEAIGLHTRIFKSGQHDVAFYQNLRNTLARGQVWTGQFINRKKNGELYREDSTISPVLDSKGVVVNYVAIKRDVSQKALTEAQLRRGQKMEAIGTLASGIAHDFNNLLYAILGYTESAKTQAVEGSPMCADLERIGEAGARAADLVRQILAFSRPGEEKAEPIRADLVVKEALKLLRATLPSNIEIRERVEEDCAQVLSNPSRIHQVIMNLCTNAYHAMRATGGVIEVSLGTCDVGDDAAALASGLAHGRYLRLAVRDTGHGMDAATLERIFDPFFTTKSVDEGTGLGLYTVHEIVKQLGGVIAVRSEPQKGSLFEVNFPACTGAVPERSAIESPLRRGSNQRILLVDDEELLAHLGSQVLSRIGYQVEAFHSSSDALAAFVCEPDRFALVITDQTMPNMTGLELAKELKRTRSNLPIIITTGFSESIEAKAGPLGIFAVLMKPLSTRELADAVWGALNGEDARPAV